MTRSRCGGKLWCLYSGGKDSATVAHLLASQDRLAGCLAIDTGISTPDWRPFIEEEAARHGWPLLIIKTPETYEAQVRKYGFPGPDMHRVMFSALKGRGVRAFKKLHPEACLASGVRRRESARRAVNVTKSGDFEGLPVVAPIHDWSTEKVWAYVEKHSLRRSPAYATVGLSGDCLCGAYATPTEKTLIEVFYPDVARRLADLEAEVGGRGWGWSNGFDLSTRQTTMESYACDSCTVTEAA